MPLIEWSNDKLGVNVEVIDSQHKRMVGMINALYDAINSCQGEAVLGELLIKLEHYTYYHFDTEEEYFQKYEYPELAVHKSQHDQLRSQVSALNEEYEKGNKMLIVKVMDLLKDWLADHILTSDRKFGYFLKKNSIKNP
jgi:hemerythrin